MSDFDPKQTWTAAIGRISKLAKGWGAWCIAYCFAVSNFFSGWAKSQSRQRPIELR